ncbi:MAG: RIP metalloprotease RseP [Eubacteriales bacterium]|nr:RIP metalloprotease RseP [Eubacteriales bacterium]
MGIIIAILIFSFIVLFHEMGHFLVAKLNGIEVEEFALGMGPLLFSKEYRGTRYCIRALPIGGACMMGEDDEATGAEGNFHSKSVWARISVIAAGPVFNFILAFVLSVILTVMVGYDRPVAAEVNEGYPAAEAGMQDGDMIIRMGDKKINIFREISTYNQFHQGETVDVTFVRDGKEHTVTLTPQYNEEMDYYLLGVTRGPNEKAGVFTSLQYGLYEVKYWICTTVSSLKMLITGQVGIDQMSGPVGIVDVVDETYNSSVDYGLSAVVANMMNISILLSANLGVMNLLPIPALDGGRLVFLLVEAVRRKKIPPEKEGYVHFIGFALLMVIMVFVMYNDIRRLFM